MLAIRKYKPVCKTHPTLISAITDTIKMFKDALSVNPPIYIDYDDIDKLAAARVKYSPQTIVGLLEDNLVYSLYENSSFCGDRIVIPSGIRLQKAFLYAENASLELVKCVDLALMSGLHWITQILDRHRETQIMAYERCYQVG